jgi:hypothetical protein
MRGQQNGRLIFSERAAIPARVTLRRPNVQDHYCLSGSVVTKSGSIIHIARQVQAAELAPLA